MKQLRFEGSDKYPMINLIGTVHRQGYLVYGNIRLPDFSWYGFRSIVEGAIYE